MILLIDNYDSFTYNLYQCIEAQGFQCQVIRNDRITVDEIRRFKPDKIVISPGPGEPHSAGISLKVIESLSDKIPILGVCLGHQSIGQVFGGQVVRAKKPKHGKLSKIYHSGHGIFEGMPQSFIAARYHSLVIDEDTLPPCLEVIARSEDQVIMGIQHRELPVVGVQFHPESIATECGEKLIRNFLRS